MAVMLLFPFFAGYAQLAPVTVITQLTPPYTPFLSQYTVAGANRLQVTGIAGIEISVKEGRTTQKTDILLLRVGRTSTVKAATLRNMIRRNELRQSFIDSLYYPITTDDNTEEWVKFHTSLKIEIIINLENLGNDPIANNEQADFVRLMAHELLHHWWTHNKKFDKFKWILIRELLKNSPQKYKYRLFDQLMGADGTTESNNDILVNGLHVPCSCDAGHERHNPDHQHVCSNQDNYQ
jgi:hypothetical protein